MAANEVIEVVASFGASATCYVDHRPVIRRSCIPLFVTPFPVPFLLESGEEQLSKPPQHADDRLREILSTVQ